VKKLSLRKKILLSAIILATLALLLVGLSYFMMMKLVFVSDNIFYGKKQSDVANELRTELLGRKDAKAVSFKNQDGQVLSGILLKRSNAKANLVLCHGYRGCKELMYGYVDIFPHFNILLFDFRAHGQSEGRIISIGCHEYQDVIAATEFMKNATQMQDVSLPLILLGISMGGASAIKAASELPTLCDALIIDSTFSDLRKIMIKGFTIKSGLPYYPFFPVIRWMFENAADCSISAMNSAFYAKKISKPVMLIHSCNDNFISPANTLKIYENLNQSKYSKVWIGPKCRHGWLHSYYSDLYRKKVSKFLRNSINTTV